ncbi:EscT/YscT/HrcT family type III secretion system export apparatus protein [Rhizobium paknamense]|uniref:Type III secretion protein T n=1 Tax=Rhizobium paknamense TaxID=1206817 RepID=A0ABU0IDR0_9HYPH|nr:flagellar biosynthetic protein FliR [Rhizobium paknamense]MDQ0456390.1 type III secretion protein T [Rhizobium paknamense]
MGQTGAMMVTADVALPAAAMVGAARALGILSIFPIFSLFNIAGILRFGLAIGLSGPAVSFAFSVLTKGQTSYFDLGALSLKEFCVGALVGAGLGLPFWAAQAAGDMTDVYRGANAANLFDQVNALETTPLGQILLSAALMLFVAGGGVVDLVAIFYRSFTFWPLLVMQPAFPGDGLAIILDLFALLFRLGAVLASPFIILTCVLELSIAFVSRSARQFSVNDSLATFKNLAVFLILIVYVVFIASYMKEAWQAGFADIRAIFDTVLHGQE